MDGLLIRNAAAADLPQIIALERATPEAPHWTEAEWDSILSSRAAEENARGRCLLVTESNKLLAGFAVARVVLGGGEAFAELESVVVHAAFRRRGFARALCVGVIDWSRSLGAGEVQLEVRAESFGAIALYAALGFVAVGRRKAYYRNPEDDALLMRLDLR